MFSLNLATKIFVIEKVQTCHLLCKKLGCYHSTSKTRVTDRIFKLSPMYASMIYQDSLNSIKVLLHLGKTPLTCSVMQTRCFSRKTSQDEVL